MLKLRDNIFYVGVKDNAVGANNNAYLVIEFEAHFITSVS